MKVERKEEKFLGKIKILDEHLANQIAAGEVVERPASIVKELVENAIDAKASKITVNLEEGGISYIRVSDNGIGMDREDALLAFDRHATSKIHKERDLFQIQTLGFRGEALPSIASVSKVELTTAMDASELAVRVLLEGGQFLGMEDCSRTNGTDVVVRELFYNTPARLKYLKTINTEISQTADVMGRLALSRPDLTFILTHNSRELFHTPGDGKLLHVIHALYGKQVASQMIKLEKADSDFSIKGYLSKPELTRSNRSYLSFILNGRYVRSVPITQSILRSYGTLLPNGRYPIGALHIEMDPKLVDVNVHPTKLEVRLSKERELITLIEEGIKEAFRKQRFMPSVQSNSNTTIASKMPKQIQPALSFSKPSAWQVKETAIKNLHPPIKENELSTMTRPSPVVTQENLEDQSSLEIIGNSNNSNNIAEQAQEATMPSASQIKQKESSIPDSPVIETDKIVESAPPTKIETVEDPSDTIQEPIDESFHSNRRLPFLLPLAQVHGTYIVAQSEDGFYLLDQHAAHERIYYEIFNRKMGEKNHHQQPLLIPLTIECTRSEAEILEAYCSELNDWGLEIEPFGGTTFIVRAYPNWFPQKNEVELIFEIIHWLKEHGKVDSAILRDASAKMMSCKAAIKANRHLRQDEMESLLSQLDLCENPFTCPHGRPIFVHFSSYDLEKLFKRVM